MCIALIILCGGWTKQEKYFIEDKALEYVTEKAPDTRTFGEKIINGAAKGVSGAYKDFSSANAQISSGMVDGLTGAENALQNAETVLRLVRTIPILGKDVEVVAVVAPIADAVGEARVIISELKSGAQAYDALVQINNDGANKAYVAVQNKDYWGALKAYWDVVPQQAMMLFDCAKNEIVKTATESFFGRIIQELIGEPTSSVSQFDTIQTPSSSHTVTLYRAMSEEEYTSLMQSKVFSASVMYYVPKLDGIGPAYCSPINVLNQNILSIRERTSN